MTPPTNSAALAAVAASTASVPVPAIAFAPVGGEGRTDVGGVACWPCPSDEVVGLLGCTGGGGVGVVGGTDGEGVIATVFRPCPSNEEAGVVGGMGDEGVGKPGGSGDEVGVRAVCRSCPGEGVTAGVVGLLWPADGDAAGVMSGLCPGDAVVGLVGRTGNEGLSAVLWRPCFVGVWLLSAGRLVNGSPMRSG